MSEPNNFWWSDAHLSVLHENPGRDRNEHQEWAKDEFQALVTQMRKTGWIIRSEYTQGHKFRSLRSTHLYGLTCSVPQEKPGSPPMALECYLKQGDRCDQVDFFQSINVRHPNGGRYDHGREHLMPYRVRLQYRRVKNQLTGWLIDRGYLYFESREYKPRTAFDKVATERANWLGWGEPYDPKTARHGSYGTKSKDGAEIKDGAEVVFYDDASRRTLKGKAYHRSGNMFHVVTNANSRFHVVPNFRIFCNKGPTKGRLVSHQESIKRRHAIIHELTTKVRNTINLKGGVKHLTPHQVTMALGRCQRIAESIERYEAKVIAKRERETAK